MSTNFNTLPENMIELTEADWAQSDYFNYDPTNTEHRQLLIADVCGKEVFHNFMLYHMPDGHGYAITNEYWNGRVRVFRFGCDHEWHELCHNECEKRNISHFGNCWHVEECAKCNQIRSYDSSG
jgi:hypothetical protein